MSEGSWSLGELERSKRTENPMCQEHRPENHAKVVLFHYQANISSLYSESPIKLNTQKRG